MLGPLLFRPLYQARVWGGRSLAGAFGRPLPAAQKIGESWEIADRPHEQSVVARGPHAGRSLRELMQAHGTALLGPGWPPGRPFPILVKWLDCQARLSLQVHPPAAIAPALGGEPKTESWYIARAEPHAALIVGLRHGVTREDFERGIASNSLEPLVHRMPVRAGDSMFVRSGRVHAIDGGSLILEIQQNSDTTYRVYDWGRVGDDGVPRTLHVQESLRCIDFDDFEPEVLQDEGADGVLADAPEFRIRRVTRMPGERVHETGDAPEARILSVVSGDVTVAAAGRHERYTSGDNILLPADTSAGTTAVTAATVLITDRFSQPAAP